MPDSSSEEDSIPIITTPPTKRKRTSDPADLEIDLTLPEPASKKAKRREKKGSAQQKEKKNTTSKNEPSSLALAAPDLAKANLDSNPAQSARNPSTTAQKRSDHGIWIGNLAFKATRETLRNFLSKEGGIEARDIVRLHLPTTTAESGNPGNSGEGGKLQKNKGFAYIDFTTKEVLEKALKLSEHLMDGRRVLIKDAKSFDGRPVKATDDPKQREGRLKKEPSKRVFVGNLGFDVTRDELKEHFTPAGEVEDVFLATFEDSGKCKGFGWVRFAEIEAATNAVMGYVLREGDDDAEGDGGENADGDTKPRKKRKREKHFINRLHGRQLRCEFAEDAQTRYKKRFSKDSNGPKRRQHDESNGLEQNDNADTAADGTTELHPLINQAAAVRQERKQAPSIKQRPDKEQRREERRKRHEKLDTHRQPVPQRASGAIIAGAGKKVKFDG